MLSKESSYEEGIKDQNKIRIKHNENISTGLYIIDNVDHIKELNLKIEYKIPWEFCDHKNYLNQFKILRYLTSMSINIS